MMTMRKTLIFGAVLLGAATAAVGAAQATYIMIDDFDDLTLGPINGQNAWHAPDADSAVTPDPDDADNQVLTVLTSSTYLRRPAILPAGKTRMLFLRFRYEEQLSVSFGMSQQLYPFQFGDFDVELNLTSTKDDLRVNDDGNYVELTSLEPQHWYNCWIAIDNAADVSSIWIHDRPFEPATAADQLSVDGRTEFPFRGLVPNDLNNFFIKTGGGDGIAGPLILDDICLQDADGVDLSYPTDTVSSVSPHPARLHLRGAWPNPFNPQTTISFTLDEAQPITLTVYDLSGRRVRVLATGAWEAGPHAIRWDGRDEAGAGAASGVYLARLTGRRGVQSTKMLLAR
jgi:hypothetical protein